LESGLKPDTSKKIQALCKKISVAHNLDSEIQEELYGHMEDRLHAYLDGEEALEEEDAFILVREHFGDATAVKGLLQNVHAKEASASLARRLAAVVIATTGVHVACLGLTSMAFYLLPSIRSFGGFAGTLTVAHAMTFILLAMLLRHWQRRLDEGETLWFLHWRPFHLISLIAALFVLQPAALITHQLSRMLPEGSESIPILVNAFALVIPTLQCILWLWWCDRPPRKIMTVGGTVLVYAFWKYSSLSGGLISSILYTVSSSDTAYLPDMTQVLTLFSLYVTQTTVTALVLYGMIRFGVAGYARWSLKDT
jgi:hypothetical protein